jgi:hypothetical protein
VISANKPELKLTATQWLDEVLFRLDYNKRCYDTLNTLKQNKYNPEMEEILKTGIEHGFIEYKDIY